MFWFLILHYKNQTLSIFNHKNSIKKSLINNLSVENQRLNILIDWLLERLKKFKSLSILNKKRRMILSYKSLLNSLSLFLSIYINKNFILITSNMSQQEKPLDNSKVLPKNLSKKFKPYLTRASSSSSSSNLFRSSGKWIEVLKEKYKI